MNFTFQPFQEFFPDYQPNSSPINNYTDMTLPANYIAPNCAPTGNAVGTFTSSYNYPNQYYNNYSSSYVPPDPYNYSSNYSAPYAAVPTDHYAPLPLATEDPFTQDQPLRSPVQDKEEILEEIVRECEAIERRSSPSSLGSSPSQWWSSDEYDTTDSPGPTRTPVKKERKKAQNRLAATRYREKKRKEKEEKMGQISGLLDQNNALKHQVDSIQSEINVLKKLMTELGVQK